MRTYSENNTGLFVCFFLCPLLEEDAELWLYIVVLGGHSRFIRTEEDDKAESSTEAWVRKSFHVGIEHKIPVTANIE